MKLSPSLSKGVETETLDWVMARPLNLFRPADVRQHPSCKATRPRLEGRGEAQGGARNAPLKTYQSG